MGIGEQLLGERGLDAGKIEYKRRADGDSAELAIAGAISFLEIRIREELAH